MDIGRADRNHARGIAATPACAPGQLALVFGPHLGGDAVSELAPVLREDASQALDEWYASTEDSVLAAGIARFLDSGDVPRLWLQSAVTGVQVALAAALGQRGLAPAAVVGLGTGELAAAVVAGRLDVGDAARVARGLSVLLAASAGAARSAAVATSRAALMRVLGARAPVHVVTLAPRLQVIAGRREAVDQASLALRAAGVEVQPPPLAGALHAAGVEALREPFLRQLGPIAPRAGHTRLYSGLAASGSAPLDAEHWWDVCRRSCQFDAVIGSMLAGGVRRFVEVGPRSAVADYILEIAAERNLGVHVEAADELLLEPPAICCA